MFAEPHCCLQISLWIGLWHTHYQNFSVQNCFVRIEQTLWLYFHFVALLQTPPRTFPDSGTITVALDFEVLGRWTTTQQCTFAIIYSEWWHVATDSSVALGIYISAPSSVSTIKQGAGALCQSEVTNFGFVCLQLSSIFGELAPGWNPSCLCHKFPHHVQYHISVLLLQLVNLYCGSLICQRKCILPGKHFYIRILNPLNSFSDIGNCLHLWCSISKLFWDKCILIVRNPMDSDCCLKREIHVPTVCNFSGRSSSSYGDVSLSSSVAFLAFKDFSGYIRFSSLYTSCESGTSRHTTFFSTWIHDQYGWVLDLVALELSIYTLQTHKRFSKSTNHRGLQWGLAA